MLFEPDKFKNAGFWFSCEPEAFWKRNFWKRGHRDNHVISLTGFFSNTITRWPVMTSAFWSSSRKHKMRQFSEQNVVFKFFRRSVDGD